MNRRFAYKAKGVSLDHLQKAVSDLVGIAPQQLVGSSKARKVVKGRMLFSYWAVREMGFSGSEIARRLQISLPTVSIAAQKGEKIVREEDLDIGTLLNVKM
jgi:chromosomal replication initiation ATPase DnaA